jgi:hypothetical protein
MTKALAFIAAASAILEAGVTLIQDAQTIGTLIKRVLDNGAPTDDDWTQLHAFEDGQRARLNASMEGENS